MVFANHDALVTPCAVEDLRYYLRSPRDEQERAKILEALALCEEN